LVKILKKIYENRFFVVAEGHFFVFRDLYLREDKSKDPEIFSIDGPKLGLPSMKLSFVLVKPQKSYSHYSWISTRDDLSKKVEFHLRISILEIAPLCLDQNE
jgi:hypothetical protein